MKYHMKPGHWCKEKYGTSDLSTIILRINNIFHPKDFTMNKIKYLTIDGINKLLLLMIKLGKTKEYKVL